MAGAAEAAAAGAVTGFLASPIAPIMYSDLSG
jgi:hypothetical protein